LYERTSGAIRLRIGQEANVATKLSYENKYGTNAEIVLSSKAKVAAAGRWGDQARIKG
jgi:uncharacterized 2Fe-2S/4Fe-4S cluster protein (DUF4445 family)